MWEFGLVIPNGGGEPPDTVLLMVESLQNSFEELDPMTELNRQPRSPVTKRPYVLTNMVASMDGAISVDGVSAGLGGPADFKVFMALRSIVDVIIVGAGTVRDEQYKAPMPGVQAQGLRAERGQAERPLIVVISRSGRLSPDLPLFADPTYRPLVIVGSDADPIALGLLEAKAEIARVSTTGVDPGGVLDDLWNRGHRTALLEGGPSLNGAFIEADCIDEWNLTLSPNLVGGTSTRASRGRTGVLHAFSISHVWTSDELLFTQWVRRR